MDVWEPYATVPPPGYVVGVVSDTWSDTELTEFQSSVDCSLSHSQATAAAQQGGPVQHACSFD